MEKNTRTTKWMKKNLSTINKSNVMVSLAWNDIERRRKEQKVRSAEKTDGELRGEIQMFIREKVKQGYSPDQLLKRLNFVFGMSKYEPYRKYFKTWIMNMVERESETKQGMPKDEEER